MLRRTRLKTVGLVALAILAVMGLAPGNSGAAAKKTTKKKTTKTTKAAPVPASTGPAATAVPASTVPPVAVSNVVWTPCGAPFDCATVKVPLDYSSPSGPKIDIGMKRIKAKGATRKGIILLNPGGPGGSGIRLLEVKPGIVGPTAAEQYDVIGFDPRGLGASTPLPCGSAQDRSARSSKQYVSAIKEACDSRAGGLRPHITTANTARDMDAIRVAMGEAKLNYLGISYGTYLGVVYADLFPDKVGRFVIDSAVDPNLRAIELQIGQFAQIEQNLLMVLRRCEVACPFADPDVVGRFDRLLAQLEKAPVVSRPYQVSAPTLLSLARALPARKGGEALLMKMMAELERRDASAIFEVIKLLDDRLPDPSDLLEGVDGDALYFQVACSEGFHPSTSPDFSNYVRLVTAQAPRFVLLAAAQTFRTCAFWDKNVETRPIPVAKPGVPPMLFVASSNDPVTPPVWTAALASRWPGSVLLRVTSFNHGATPDEPCANKAAADFFLTGTLPTPNACP